jgi:hypothetical protein
MGFPKPATGAGGNDFEPISAGLHYARCFALVDLGVQRETYRDEVKETHKIAFGFEFPDELVTFQRDGEEVTAPKILWTLPYTYSLGQKARLRKLVQSWTGKPLTPGQEHNADLTKLVGRPAQISIVHVEGKDGKAYGNINNDIVLPATPDQVKRAQAEQMSMEPLIYSTEEPQVHYARLPKFLKAKVDARIIRGQSTAGQGSQEDQGVLDEFDDSIPF